MSSVVELNQPSSLRPSLFFFLSNLHILTGRHWVILERKKYPTIATDLLLCNGSDYFPKQESRSRMGDARRPSL